jgi:methionine sulfoxide reductase heme-binding subunit
MKTFSRLFVHACALTPLVKLVIDFFTGELTANPIQAATQRTGDTALVLLILSLTCTPVVILTGIKGISSFRKTLGLYAFLYASLHFLIYAGLDYAFNLALIWGEIVEKRYILAGICAGMILLALAVTSFQWWKRRLGKNWKRLHRLVYLAGILAVFHYFWVVKADTRLPLLAGGILTGLLLLRVPLIRNRVVRARQKKLSAW